MASRLRLVAATPDPASGSIPDADVESREEGAGGAKRPEPPRREVTDLGGGSELVHVPRFAPRDTAWEWFDSLDKTIPWTRPPIRVFGRSVVQPRDTCYVADEGLTDLKYSGHQPHAHSWDEFPVLKDILKAVHEALPGSYFNSLLLNRYKNGSDYVSWHADDEPLYGPAPEIASLTLGCEREFLLRKKPNTKSQGMMKYNPDSSEQTLVLSCCEHITDGNIVDLLCTKHLPAASGSREGAQKRLKVTPQQQHSFLLKHGSLLVMRGYTQRDWQHSVPKRAKASSSRINLTFRRVLT